MAPWPLATSSRRIVLCARVGLPVRASWWAREIVPYDEMKRSWALSPAGAISFSQISLQLCDPLLFVVLVR